MITVPLVQTADVDALKCIYFQLVGILQEIDWYGLDCNKTTVTDDIETAFVYLESLITNCTLVHQFQCEIKNFITRNSSYCIFLSEKCTSKTSVVEQYYLITESGDPIITEDSQNITI